MLTDRNGGANDNISGAYDVNTVHMSGTAARIMIKVVHVIQIAMQVIGNAMHNIRKVLHMIRTAVQERVVSVIRIAAHKIAIMIHKYGRSNSCNKHRHL